MTLGRSRASRSAWTFASASATSERTAVLRDWRHRLPSSEYHSAYHLFRYQTARYSRISRNPQRPRAERGPICRQAERRATFHPGLGCEHGVLSTANARRDREAKTQDSSARLRDRVIDALDGGGHGASSRGRGSAASVAFISARTARAARRLPAVIILSLPTAKTCWLSG